jgi:hypothetical protein
MRDNGLVNVQWFAERAQRLRSGSQG